MASKWSDQFDLDDQYDRKKGKKEDNKKNRQSITNNDFEDLEDDNRNLKLPTITKNIAPSAQKNTKSNSNLNLQQIYKKKGEVLTNKKEQKNEDSEYQFQQSLAPNPSSFKQKSPPKNENKKANNEQISKNAEQNYEQQFQDEKYEQDFEQHQEKKLSPVGYKPKQQTIVPTKTVNVPKPQEKSRKGAESVAKKTQISGKANSRNSIRSQSASRIANSNVKAQQKKEEPPNKYTNLAQRTCPNYERATLSQFPSDKLVRENDKIRGMIKKLNDELNDLINKNIMQLKNKKEEKVVLPDDIIKVLEQQKNSNQTAYQTTAKQLQRLKGKQGQIRQEEFLISLDQKIAETKASLNEYAKNITKLKLEVANEGNKLTKIDKETNITQQINNLKNNVVLIKKQEQKNDQVLQKLYIKMEELTKKNTEVDIKYNEQIESAKAKGFSVQINPEIVKKSQQNKKKIENIRLHKSKTQNLYKTKCDMITHQCEQIKNQIKSTQVSIQCCQNNCEQIQNEIKKFIQKAKKNAKLPQQIILSLQSIISQLQNGTPSSNKGKQDTNSLSYPKGAKKYQSQKNVEKIQVVTKQQEKQKNEDEVNLKKPNLFKKREKQDEKQDERVWKDDKNSQPKKQQKMTASNPISQLAKFQNKQQVQKKDDEKKKPFVIKKNKDIKVQQNQNVPQIVKQQVKIQKIQTKREPQKNQQIPSIAPRMMKFKKNKQQTSKAEQPIKIQQTIEKPVFKIAEKQPQKAVQQQVQKPIFAPKRFQLRQKDKANEQPGYMASISERKQQVKVVEEFKPKGLTIEKDPIPEIKEIKAQPLKIEQKKITLNEQGGQKPKFNLRLRDRQRQSNKQQIKIQNKVETKAQNTVPIQTAKEIEPKINITLNDKAKENNNQYVNPYATNDPPKRQRQGPLKKQKLAQNTQKTNFNIYDQAQDITNVKQIKIGKQSPPKQKQPISKQSEEPSLQDLLGIKKKNNAADEDLLIDTKILGNKQNKNEKKKDSNFFGDLQL